MCPVVKKMRDFDVYFFLSRHSGYKNQLFLPCCIGVFLFRDVSYLLFRSCLPPQMILILSREAVFSSAKAFGVERPCNVGKKSMYFFYRAGTCACRDERNEAVACDGVRLFCIMTLMQSRSSFEKINSIARSCIRSHYVNIASGRAVERSHFNGWNSFKLACRSSMLASL